MEKTLSIKIQVFFFYCTLNHNTFFRKIDILQDFSGPLLAPGANFGLQNDPRSNENPDIDQNPLQPPIPQVKKELKDEDRRNPGIVVNMPVVKNPESKLDSGANEKFKNKNPEKHCKYFFLIMFYI
jgi:hypothetical protein